MDKAKLFNNILFTLNRMEDKILINKRLFSKLIQPKIVPFSEVKKIFWEENKKGDSNSKWPFHLINNADQQVGIWVLTKIPYEVFINIKLPYHYHGEKILVPRRGLTLKETYNKLRRIEEKYKKTNPLCFSKIDYFSKKDIGTIILSSVTPKGRDSYGEIFVRKHLIHIDGLHRMLGEMYKLERKSYKPVKCIIAVKEGQK